MSTRKINLAALPILERYKEHINWTRAAAKPVALVIRDWHDAGGAHVGSTIAHRDAGGTLHGCRDVTFSPNYESIVAAWIKDDTERKGLALEDTRTVKADPHPFEQDKEETPVVFRVWPKREGGDVIALFPAEPHALSGWTCGSYMHVGQHSAADYGLIYRTRPAKPTEYADLKSELESAPFGYRLKVYQRITNKHREALRAEQERLRNMPAQDGTS